jgi:hypothetical protein
MRCPACKVENANDATECSACGKALRQRPRRRSSAEEANAASGPEAEQRNAAALRAYRVCLAAIVPGPGLVLGPLAVVMAVIARVRGRGVEGFTDRGLTTGAIVLGTLITATQWAGVTLMVVGWGARP